MADEQKPSGAWAWLAVIAGALFWFLKRKKPKPPIPPPSSNKPPRYEKRVGVGSLMWIWPLEVYKDGKLVKKAYTAEKALATLSSLGLTGVRAFTVRPPRGLIPWGKSGDIYRVVPGDIVWSEQHAVFVRQFLGWCSKFGIIVTLDLLREWCSERFDSTEDWGGHPLNSKFSNSGMKNQWESFDKRHYPTWKLLLKRMWDDVCKDYEPILEVTMGNELPANDENHGESVRNWERHMLDYAKELGFERRVTSSEGSYARDLLRGGRVYAIQWHGIEDTGDINKGVGQQHIYDTDGAENKDKIDYGALARKCIRGDAHFHALACGDGLDAHEWQYGALEATAEEMKWWHQIHPKP